MRFIRRATLFGLLALARGFVLEPRRAAARCVASSGGASELDAPPPMMPPPPKKVLLLMSDTGGGHRASAEALAAAFDALHPGAVACEVVDLWADHARWPFDTYPAAYAFMAKEAPWLYKLLYELTALPPARALYDELVLARCGASFGAALGAAVPARERADAVVSVHPLLNNVPRRVLARLDDQQRAGRAARGATPFATVVTDLGACHPTWFDRDVDLCFVPGETVERLARRAGMPDASLRRRGLPLREGFWPRDGGGDGGGGGGGAAADAAAKAAARDALGLAQRPTALLVGGGDGVGGLEEARPAALARAGRGDDAEALFPPLSISKRARAGRERGLRRAARRRAAAARRRVRPQRARARRARGARGRARRRGGRRGGRRRAERAGLRRRHARVDDGGRRRGDQGGPGQHRRGVRDRPADAADDVPARSGGGQRRVSARARCRPSLLARALSV